MNAFPSKSLSDNRKSAIQNRKWAGLFAIVVVAFTVCGARAEAQQPTKVPRIGYLSVSSPSANVGRIEAFRQGLRELGYVEGKNIVIEWRYAEGKFDRLPTLAAELVRLKVNIIVTAGSQATRVAKKATVTIPILMGFDPDPVGGGFVASLARPGGNITGLSSLGADLPGKRLELLKEILPKLSDAAVLGTSTNPGNVPALKATKLAAGPLRVQLQFLDVLSPKDIETAFRAATKARVDAVIVLNSPINSSRRREIAGLAVKNQLPTFYDRSDYIEDGGLMSYGVNFTDLAHRAATYVDKILKGAKPAELPVEQPTKFESIISLKAAKQIGLTIPPNVLARADKVIR